MTCGSAMSSSFKSHIPSEQNAHTVHASHPSFQNWQARMGSVRLPLVRLRGVRTMDASGRGAALKHCAKRNSAYSSTRLGEFLAYLAAVHTNIALLLKEPWCSGEELVEQLPNCHFLWVLLQLLSGVDDGVASLSRPSHGAF